MPDYKARIDLDSKGFELGVKKATESNKEFKESTEKSSKALDKNEKSLNSAARATMKHKQKVAEAEKQVKQFQSSISAVQSSLGNMMAGFSSGSIAGFMQGVLGAQGAISSLQASMIGATGSATGLGAALNLALGPIGLITAGIAAVVGVSAAAISANADLEEHVSKLSALTGATGDDLKYMKDQAIDMSKSIHMASGDIVDAFMLVGSAVPSLLQNKEALSEVTKQAMILSKVSGMDAAESVKALTTVINQMNVPATEAADIINTLAAGSKQGAADIPYLAVAFEKAGTQAKSAGMDFVDLTAAIETVRPKFSSADVAGSQLNSTLLALSVQAEDKFKPAVVGMKTALDNLAKAELDDVKLKELVGASNITMIKTLIESRDQYDEYTRSLRGTQTAYDQFATVMDTLKEDINGLKQAWNAFLETLGSTGVFDTITGGLREIIQNLTAIINKTSEWIKAAMNLEIVRDLVTIISAAIKYQYEVLKTVAKYILEALKYIVKYLNEAYTWLKNLLGLSGKKVEVEVEVKGDLIPEGALPSGNNTTHSTTPTTPKAPKKVNPKAGSRDYIKKQIADIDNELSTKITIDDAEAREKLKAEKKALQKQLDDLEIELGYKDPKEVKEGLNKLKAELSDLEKELSSLPIGVDASDLINKIEAKKKEIEKQEIYLKIKADPNVALGKKYSELTKPSETSSFDKATAEPIAANEYDGQLSAIQAQMDANDNLIEQLKELRAEYEAIGSQGTLAYNEVNDKIKEVNENQAELGERAKDIKSSQKSAKNLGNALSFASSASSSLASAISAIGQNSQDSGVQTAVIIAEAIANIVSGYAAASAQAASMGPWAWAAFAVAGLALVAATIAQIHALTGGGGGGSYANGGIIQGSSTMGDNLIAHVNAGEMILNSRQQNNLFDMINKGQGNESEYSNNQVEFKIRGQELVGILSNYNQRRSKI